MSEFKKFTKSGNQYIMKKQYSVALVVVLGMAACTYGGIYYKNSTVIWIFGILTILCAISMWTQKFYIDLDENEFVVKYGLINKPVQIPFSAFQNFELVKIRRNLITTNVTLNLYYIKDNKEKCTGIAQGFTTKSMQILVNEINDILQSDDHSRKL